MYNIAIVFGGGSCENDVSIITALQAWNEIDKEKYNVFALYLTCNKFFLINNPDINQFVNWKEKKQIEVVFVGKKLFKVKKNQSKFLSNIDCALLCTHGGIGENGSLQGYFEVCGVPYTSPNVEVSAVGMNKTLSKIIFQNLGIDVVPFVGFSSKDNMTICLQNAVKKLGFPIIVKPNSQGSSIGIEVAKTELELEQAVKIAFEYDDKIVLEKALTDFEELNCAVMISQDDIVLSTLEQPTRWQDYLSFEDKYMGFGKMSRCERIFPANVTQETTNKVHTIALTIYQYLYIKGIVRMDFLVDNESQKVYLNEINTIPGSLSFYLFSDKNLKMKDILDIVITQSMFEFDAKQKPKFKSELLSKYYKSNANACKKLAKPL